MEDRIRAIIGSIRGYEPMDINFETNLIDDLQFESIDIMNLILAIESEFGFTFRDEHLDLDHFLTFANILQTLQPYGERQCTGDLRTHST